jgi:hypothetical protein
MFQSNEAFWRHLFIRFTERDRKGCVIVCFWGKTGSRTKVQAHQPNLWRLRCTS